MTAVFVGKGVNNTFRQTVLKILEEKTDVFEISDSEIKRIEFSSIKGTGVEEVKAAIIKAANGEEI